MKRDQDSQNIKKTQHSKHKKFPPFRSEGDETMSKSRANPLSSNGQRKTPPS